LPRGADNLAGARRRQDREFERSGGEPVAFPQIRHERGELGIWQARVVFDRGHLRPLRQQMVEIAFLGRRVFAAAVAERLGVVENALDPAANSAGRLGFRRPDRPARFEVSL
jgi:hypothetical protein